MILVITYLSMRCPLTTGRSSYQKTLQAWVRFKRGALIASFNLIQKFNRDIYRGSNHYLFQIYHSNYYYYCMSLTPFSGFSENQPYLPQCLYIKISHLKRKFHKMISKSHFPPRIIAAFWNSSPLKHLMVNA